MNETNTSTEFTVEEALPILQATPSVLRSLFQQLPGPLLDFAEEPDAWSPRIVLVHFIQNERSNWIPRLKVLFSDGAQRAFAPFQQLPDPGQIEDRDVARMLGEFSALRRENLEHVKGFHIAPQDYARTAIHPSLGTVTLRQLLATWVVHDLNHTHQILKSLAQKHREAVGPWKQYLGILDL
jgi:uncharacterized damage-inducible protein DinB